MISNLQFFEVDGGMVSIPEESTADNPSGDTKVQPEIYWVTLIM